ncbi:MULTISPECIES: energy-coupling factor transporter transmembrane protein EcfT [unclassified Halorubrum]|uniref:energy-coupling factor transporter transmembrane component T family protein n=1 Tax=unclassified Halorubrum TaxID=2642239 RepID=UPI000B99771B|nr:MULTISPECIES: energy-coupling factor transporter transmembrane protein EcfT [unclassified Halorubrum]OYR42449.1 cobalt ABC transporter permease [Halorubrum sp. Eb13]OYR42572.1 cobalt ABC transporter permease [Halorubrum sp. Hd13]OYR45946.1 cobalt ABC transporter permease [Halorubrum sp. Ea8]OYR56349.1 cobalt ABC transporter permease [Halorubrum sp. Ea1]
MTLAYVPDDALAHRLDPRSKLLVQLGFAAAAFAHTTPRGLAALSVVAVGCLRLAGGGPRDLWAYRFALPFLLVAPVVAGATLGAPWFRIGRAVDTGLASYRVLLVLFIAAAYVRSTPVRDSRAAIQHTVPGRPGQLLAAGVALVFRFLPVLKRDLLTARDAMRARLGDELAVRDRMRIVAAAGINRAFGRADRLGTALAARCFAWNPTLPRLAFGRADAVALAVACALFAAALVGAL